MYRYKKYSSEVDVEPVRRVMSNIHKGMRGVYDHLDEAQMLTRRLARDRDLDLTKVIKSLINLQRKVQKVSEEASAISSDLLRGSKTAGFYRQSKLAREILAGSAGDVFKSLEEAFKKYVVTPATHAKILYDLRAIYTKINMAVALCFALALDYNKIADPVVSSEGFDADLAKRSNKLLSDLKKLEKDLGSAENDLRDFARDLRTSW